MFGFSAFAQSAFGSLSSNTATQNTSGHLIVFPPPGAPSAILWNFDFSSNTDVLVMKTSGQTKLSVKSVDFSPVSKSTGKTSSLNVRISEQRLSVVGGKLSNIKFKTAQDSQVVQISRGRISNIKLKAGDTTSYPSVYGRIEKLKIYSNRVASLDYLNNSQGKSSSLKVKAGEMLLPANVVGKVQTKSFFKTGEFISLLSTVGKIQTKSFFEIGDFISPINTKGDITRLKITTFTPAAIDIVPKIQGKVSSLNFKVVDYSDYSDVGKLSLKVKASDPYRSSVDSTDGKIQQLKFIKTGDFISPITTKGDITKLKINALTPASIDFVTRSLGKTSGFKFKVIDYSDYSDLGSVSLKRFFKTGDFKVPDLGKVGGFKIKVDSANQISIVGNIYRFRQNVPFANLDEKLNYIQGKIQKLNFFATGDFSQPKNTSGKVSSLNFKVVDYKPISQTIGKMGGLKTKIDSTNQVSVVGNIYRYRQNVPFNNLDSLIPYTQGKTSSIKFKAADYADYTDLGSISLKRIFKTGDFKVPDSATLQQLKFIKTVDVISPFLTKGDITNLKTKITPVSIDFVTRSLGKTSGFKFKVVDYSDYTDVGKLSLKVKASDVLTPSSSSAILQQLKFIKTGDFASPNLTRGNIDKLNVKISPASIDFVARSLGKTSGFKFKVVDYSDYSDVGSISVKRFFKTGDFKVSDPGKIGGIKVTIDSKNVVSEVGSIYRFRQNIPFMNLDALIPFTQGKSSSLKINVADDTKKLVTGNLSQKRYFSGTHYIDVAGNLSEKAFFKTGDFTSPSSARGIIDRFKVVSNPLITLDIIPKSLAKLNSIKVKLVDGTSEPNFALGKTSGFKFKVVDYKSPSQSIGKVSGLKVKVDSNNTVSEVGSIYRFRQNIPFTNLDERLDYIDGVIEKLKFFKVGDFTPPSISLGKTSGFNFKVGDQLTPKVSLGNVEQKQSFNFVGVISPSITQGKTSSLRVSVGDYSSLLLNKQGIIDRFKTGDFKPGSVGIFDVANSRGNEQRPIQFWS